MSSETMDKSSTQDDGYLQKVTAEIVRSLRGLRFGSLEVVVHDGKVVQIQRTEKLRVESGSEGRR